MMDYKPINVPKYSKSCGLNARDFYDDYCLCNVYSNSDHVESIYERKHTIIGSGRVSSCSAKDNYKNRDDYVIGDGITELADGCFSKRSVSSIKLPSTLIKIGNGCFQNSIITSLSLPEKLESIGENNFPPTLESINIPPLLSCIPISNFLCCDKITNIIVDGKNANYKDIDGVLYRV